MPCIEFHMVFVTVQKYDFRLVAIDSTATMVVCTRLVGHCYSCGCDCGISLDVVVSYYMYHHMEVILRQTIQPECFVEKSSLNVSVSRTLLYGSTYSDKGFCHMWYLENCKCFHCSTSFECLIMTNHFMRARSLENFTQEHIIRL